MTSRELEILNIIHRLGGQCSLRVISKEMGLSSDYAYLISKGLLNQKLIKKIANNILLLTLRGRSLLERSRDDLEKKRKTPILIEVSRSFGKEVETTPSFKPEISFINKGFAVGEPVLTEHNLGAAVVIEVANARLIQKSVKRLTFVNPVRNSEGSQRKISNGVNRKRSKH